MVDVDEERGPPHLQFKLTPAPTLSSLPLLSRELCPTLPLEPEIGTCLELSSETWRYAQDLGKHIAQFGGAGLVVDYGEDHAPANSLQAVRSHSYVNPLEDVGMADITCHVDFSALLKAARDASPTIHTLGPVTQGHFLLDMGLPERLEVLAETVDDEAFEPIYTGAERLVDPKQMGSLFKVAAITSLDTPLPGLSPTPSPS
mmetsp:Transcript_37028/g.86086  ORF Transcript_37028/g.86086 Transcript_37028/m.86086 type:complete len:202 (+) Transcript_37028:426-1031(+)